MRDKIEQLQWDLDHAQMDASDMRALAGERMACIRILEKERDDLREQVKQLYRLIELLTNELNTSIEMIGRKIKTP